MTTMFLKTFFEICRFLHHLFHFSLQFVGKKWTTYPVEFLTVWILLLHPPRSHPTCSSLLGILVNQSLDHAPRHPPRQAFAAASPSSGSCQSPDVRGVKASGQFSAFIVPTLPAALHVVDHSLPETPLMWLPGHLS